MRGVDGPDLESYPMARPQSPVEMCSLSGWPGGKGRQFREQPASLCPVFMVLAVTPIQGDTGTLCLSGFWQDVVGGRCWAQTKGPLADLLCRYNKSHAAWSWCWGRLKLFSDLLSALPTCSLFCTPRAHSLFGGLERLMKLGQNVHP